MQPFKQEQYIMFSQLHELKACVGVELCEQRWTPLSLRPICSKITCLSNCPVFFLTNFILKSEFHYLQSMTSCGESACNQLWLLCAWHPCEGPSDNSKYSFFLCPIRAWAHSYEINGWPWADWELGLGGLQRRCCRSRLRSRQDEGEIADDLR